MARLSHLPRLDYSNYTWRRVQITTTTTTTTTTNNNNNAKLLEERQTDRQTDRQTEAHPQHTHIWRPSIVTATWSTPCRPPTVLCWQCEFLRIRLHCLLKYWPTLWKWNKGVLLHDFLEVQFDLHPSWTSKFVPGWGPLQGIQILRFFSHRTAFLNRRYAIKWTQLKYLDFVLTL
jgi:hypothetical protein